MAKIDILLPFWGDVSLFKKTVKSVLSQTERDWRLLIFDDCYPSDEQRKYIESLQEKRIVYTRNETNLGITANFNKALSSAEAKYCSIIGCDDRLAPNYIERALQIIGEADFYQPGVSVIDRDDNVYLPLADRVKRILRPHKAGYYSGERLAMSLCRGNWLYFPSIVWKTSVLQRYRFDEKYKVVQDVALEFSMIADGAKLYLDNVSTFEYRRFAESLSSKEKSKGGIRFSEEGEVYRLFANKFSEMGWTRAARAARIRLTSRLHQLIR